MGRLMVVLVSGALLISTAVAVAQREYPAAATIRGENVWLRIDPAEDTEVVAYLQRGDAVLVTDDATAADGGAFYPIEVIETGETGWVRELAIDPRTFAGAYAVAVEMATATLIDADPQNEQPRRTRNRAARSETASVAGDRPLRIGFRLT